MLKNLLTLFMTTVCCLNTWAAPPAQASKSQPRVGRPVHATFTGFPIPACWIVPVSCR